MCLDPIPPRHAVGRRHAGRSSRHAARAVPLDDQHAEALKRTVETEIIPRLMLLHRAAQVQLAEVPGATCSRTSGTRSRHSPRACSRATTPLWMPFAHVRNGACRPLRCACTCFAPAAGGWASKWTADECDFAQVTIGLGRLQDAARRRQGLPSLPRRGSAGALRPVRSGARRAAHLRTGHGARVLPRFRVGGLRRSARMPSLPCWRWSAAAASSWSGFRSVPSATWMRWRRSSFRAQGAANRRLLVLGGGPRFEPSRPVGAAPDSTPPPPTPGGDRRRQAHESAGQGLVSRRRARKRERPGQAMQRPAARGRSGRRPHRSGARRR